MKNGSRGVSGSEQLLVEPGKSSRLDAFRKKSGLPVNQADSVKKHNLHTEVAGLDQQTKETLHQAKAVIEERMSSILNAYPSGKKNTFFKIKYGADTHKIKDMAMQELFKLLELDIKKIKHFQLIENMYLNGEASGTKG